MNSVIKKLAIDTLYYMLDVYISWYVAHCVQMYLHVRIFLSENRKKMEKKSQTNQLMQTEFSLTQKNPSRAKCDEQWAFWCRRLWRNKWPYFHWETPRVGSYCCSRDVLEPGLGDNHKYKLTDNSHLASSETGMIKENGSCEKRAIT